MYFLIIIILLLIVVIFYLSSNFVKITREHARKVETLRGMIVELLNNQNLQSEQIKLSDELKEKLSAANVTLSHDIGSMVYDFIDTLSKNNLLDKQQK
jgi:predicted Holliday junction resolvase-like endonuclease